MNLFQKVAGGMVLFTGLGVSAQAQSKPDPIKACGDAHSLHHKANADLEAAKQASVGFFKDKFGWDLGGFTKEEKDAKIADARKTAKDTLADVNVCNANGYTEEKIKHELIVRDLSTPKGKTTAKAGQEAFAENCETVLRETGVVDALAKADGTVERIKATYKAATIGYNNEVASACIDGGIKPLDIVAKDAKAKAAKLGISGK